VPPAVQRSLVSDQVFRVLCEDVLSGRYEPGEKLPTQRRLAADLGVNMASVREAVKRLEQLRLVESRQGEGMRVRDWRAHGGLDVIAHVLLGADGLERGTLADLMEARRSLLVGVARLAAERRTPKQAERLRELAGRIGSAEDGEAAQALDFAFFSELVEAAGNVVLVLVMNSIRRIYFARGELFVAIVGIPREPYARAARAVKRRQPEAAARAVAELAALQEGALVESLA
jgi:GntR family transcriptional regulator, transcriptional repressor for pyruvate dehydrogenase complex